ncbi:class I SAM-dependent methyltransferase [Sphingomonas changnyeongensis]|uniref:class I SAM-dependent methyltransferase n=1 Tax=Sphingomonas changnyeongensis TaxID=2698679 RepID=UPI001E3BC0B5|nr:class I SAM-dependent methyltransferase [Sphingomonas changnyeongensis]
MKRRIPLPPCLELTIFAPFFNPVDAASAVNDCGFFHLFALRTSAEQTAAMRTVAPLRNHVNHIARHAHVIAHSEQNALANRIAPCQTLAMANRAGGSADTGRMMLWSAFWRGSTRDGCTAAFPPAAQQAISAGWQALFAGRPRTTRILDIACGRGAVLAVAAEAGIDSRIGVDLADGDSIGSPDAQILGGVDARHLPFADRSFDLVVSQFGLEYAGLDEAVDEAARVTGGEIAWLLHAAEGAVVQQAREQIAQADWIDHDLGGLTAIARGPAALGPLLSEVIEAARTAANTALLEGFYHHAQALAAQGDPALIDRFAADWREHRARMADLVRAAPDAGMAARACKRLADAGFDVELTDLCSADALVGRWLKGRRRC